MNLCHTGTKRRSNHGTKKYALASLISTSGTFIPSKRLTPEQAAVRDPMVIASAERKEMRKSGLLNDTALGELLQEVETQTKVKYSGKYGHILTEITKSQREILQSLNIVLPLKT